MSVKELILDNEDVRFKIVENIITLFSSEGEIDFTLDRNQTHLLMLYLQEHLK